MRVNRRQTRWAVGGNAAAGLFLTSLWVWSDPLSLQLAGTGIISFVAALLAEQFT